LFKSSNRMGACVVIRNHIGDCLAACSELLHTVTTPELAEALALRCALALAREEGYDQVMVASDCLSVVQHTKSTA
jgi:ribonuclease HI